MILLDSTYDKEKILQCMFDPNTSEILTELEHGGKELQYLTEKLKILEDEVYERLSYLIKHDFVKEEKINDKIIFSVDADKLAKLVEHEKNFDDVVDGLAKMDSYLN